MRDVLTKMWEMMQNLWFPARLWDGWYRSMLLESTVTSDISCCPQVTLPYGLHRGHRTSTNTSAQMRQCETPHWQCSRGRLRIRPHRATGSIWREPSGERILRDGTTKHHLLAGRERTIAANGASDGLLEEGRNCYCRRVALRPAARS